jgi:hypothetical protein
MMASNRAALTLIFALSTASCGPELLGGAQKGEVRTVATHEEGSSSGSAQHAATAPDAPAAAREAGESPAGGTFWSTASASGVEGDLSLDAAAWLITAEGEQVPITDGTVTAAFRMEGPDEVLLGRADVEARSYTAVRVVFTRVEADVEGGVIINGEPFVGLVSVQMGSANRVVVERPIELTVRRRSTQTIVVDLDAHQWLPATVLPDRTVPALIFSSVVDVRVR